MGGRRSDEDPKKELSAYLNGHGQEDPQAYLRDMYAQLHQLARRVRRGQPPGLTILTDDLVSLTFLKLTPNERKISDRHHFLALAVKAMRDILIDHARKKCARKRSADGERVGMDETVEALERHSQVDLLALHEALVRLDVRDPIAAKVVELRFFGDLKTGEIARILKISKRTVDREWEFARTLLARELSK